MKHAGIAHLWQQGSTAPELVIQLHTALVHAQRVAAIDPLMCGRAVCTLPQSCCGNIHTSTAALEAAHACMHSIVRSVEGVLPSPSPYSAA